MCILIWTIWVSIIILFIIIYNNRRYHSRNLITLQKSSNRFLKQQTLHEENVMLLGRDTTERNCSNRKFKGLCRIYVKEDGIVFRPFLIQEFGIDFKNIVIIKVKTLSIGRKPQRLIIIRSQYDIYKSVAFITDSCILLIDEISRRYSGEIVGYEY